MRPLELEESNSLVGDMFVGGIPRHYDGDGQIVIHLHSHAFTTDRYGGGIVIKLIKPADQYEIGWQAIEDNFDGPNAALLAVRK